MTRSVRIEEIPRTGLAECPTNDEPLLPSTVLHRLPDSD